MHSILISSKDKEKALEFARKISRDNKIHELDLTIIETDTLGIDDVRNFQKKALLKPFKSLKKIVFLTTSQLTLESQNALLKILEEPPEDTIIILHVPDKYSVLPTILSRCKVIELSLPANATHQALQAGQYLNILISLKNKRVGDRLRLAQDLSKDKDDALLNLEKMIIGARQKLLEQYLISLPANATHQALQAGHYHNILISLQRTYTIIKTTNVNLRLALENLFLNL